RLRGGVGPRAGRRRGVRRPDRDRRGPEGSRDHGRDREDPAALKLIVVRLSSLGDVIHALPVAESAARAGAIVGWGVGPALAGALGGTPHCATILAADTKGWRRSPLSPRTRGEVAALRSEMRAFAPGVVLDVQGLFKSAVIARLAGAPVIGFSAA